MTLWEEQHGVLHHPCLVLEIRLTPTVLLVTTIKQQLFSSGRQGEQWDLKALSEWHQQFHVLHLLCWELRCTSSSSYMCSELRKRKLYTNISFINFYPLKSGQKKTLYKCCKNEWCIWLFIKWEWGFLVYKRKKSGVCTYINAHLYRKKDLFSITEKNMQWSLKFVNRSLLKKIMMDLLWNHFHSETEANFPKINKKTELQFSCKMYLNVLAHVLLLTICKLSNG